MTLPRFSSIRTRIALLILVPLLALTSLWGFLTGSTYGDAHLLLQSRDFQEEMLLPTQRLIEGLQKERRLSTAALGAAGQIDPAAMRAQRQSTDTAVKQVRKGGTNEGLRGAIQSEVVRRMDELLRRIDRLRALRRGVDEQVVSRADTLRIYSELIDAGFAVYNAATPGEGSITSDARMLTAFARAREFMAREDALLTGALAAGRISVAERGQFAQLVGAQRTLYADTAPNLPGDNKAGYERLAVTPPFIRLRALEDRVVHGADLAAPRRTRESVPRGAGRRAAEQGIEPAAWRSDFDTASDGLYKLENAVLDDVTANARDVAVGVFLRLALAGGLGLLAIVLSTLIAVRVSRRLLRECQTLAAGVVEFTRDRLPKVPGQVRAGRPAEPAPTPEIGYRIDEIRQIAESFDRARDAVLRAAEGEDAARRGISEVFVNLARRNQALLHRQLSLLDTMERRTEDPSELSDLFRLDHLATRMRRHAEGLVILAGKSAGRGWRRPVPLVDVVRGAVAEVEDYPRVRVQPLPRVALLGTAVADVIHLLAEVVENATTFSPPQSPVRVGGQPVASGFAIEVEDRGLGMTEEALRIANARLADPPEFDPSDSAQLGLFVVARLAERHDIQVTLRPSPYGGTTAIALIPGSLIVEDAEAEPSVLRSTGPMQALPDPPGALPSAARPAVGSGPAEASGPVRLVAEPDEPRAREEARPPEPQPEPEPEPAPPAPAPPEAPLKEGELPKRRRQQHLAPQLKRRVDEHLAAEGQAAPAEAPAEPVEPPAVPEPAAGMPLSAPVPMDAEPPPPAPPADEAPEAAAERSPEAMRSMMSAMQRGWQRGRHAAAETEDEAGAAEARARRGHGEHDEHHDDKQRDREDNTP